MDHIRTVFDSLFTISIFDVLNNFIKNLLNVKSSDCIDLLSKLHTSRAYSKVGKHFCFCYILPANGRTQTRKNDRKYILKQTKHQTKSQFVYKDMSHVTAGARCEVFDRSQKMRALLRKQIV